MYDAQSADCQNKIHVGLHSFHEVCFMMPTVMHKVPTQ